VWWEIGSTRQSGSDTRGSDIGDPWRDVYVVQRMVLALSQMGGSVLDHTRALLAIVALLRCVLAARRAATCCRSASPEAAAAAPWSTPRRG
jgi:hypothetical protein